MTTELTSLGLSISRFAGLVSEMEDAAKGLWGESVDTSQEQLLGHHIRQASLALAEINETLQAVLDVTSAANASGVYLDHLFALIGLERQSAAKSTVTLTYTVSAATTVPAGHKVKTSAGVVFETVEDLVFTGEGSGDVEAQCTENGAHEAEIGEVSKPVTTLYGLVSVTNADAAIPGRLRETDAQFRTRHTAAVATSGEDDVASIYEAVSAVEGVSSAYVVEDTDTHSITVSVIGGNDDDVAAAINNNRTAGIPTVGDQSVDVYSETTGQSAVVNFYRAENKEFYLSATIARNTALFPADGEDQIKSALTAIDYNISDKVYYFGLLSPLYSIAGVTVIQLKIGWDSSNLKTDDLATTSVQRPSLPSDNISISYVS